MSPLSGFWDPWPVLSRGFRPSYQPQRPHGPQKNISLIVPVCSGSRVLPKNLLSGGGSRAGLPDAAQQTPTRRAVAGLCPSTPPFPEWSSQSCPYLARARRKHPLPSSNERKVNTQYFLLDPPPSTPNCSSPCVSPSSRPALNKSSVGGSCMSLQCGPTCYHVGHLWV